MKKEGKHSNALQHKSWRWHKNHTVFLPDETPVVHLKHKEKGKEKNKLVTCMKRIQYIQYRESISSDADNENVYMYNTNWKFLNENLAI